MKRLMVFALVILGVGASSALAQPPRGGRGGAGMMGGPMMLLNQQSVQQELESAFARWEALESAASS